MSEEAEKVIENQDETRQAEDGSPADKSGVRPDPWAGATNPAYEIGDRVSAKVKLNGVSRKVTATVNDHKTVGGNWQYRLSAPADGGWYKETDLDFA